MFTNLSGMENYCFVIPKVSFYGVYFFIKLG